MKKPNFQNEKIKQMGDNILSAIRLSDTEVERIVGSTELFGSILETARNDEFLENNIDLTNSRSGFYVYRWQISIACCCVLILTTVFILLSDFKSGPVTLQIAEIDKTPFTLTIETPENMDIREKVKPPASEKNQPPLVSSAKPGGRYSAAKSNEPGKQQNPVILPFKKTPAKLNTIKSKKQDDEEMMSEFQFLTFDLDTNREGGRIVRVELPRASLFAMGVNLPPENGKAMVKTDLYIGSDGTMKAVRIARLN